MGRTLGCIAIGLVAGWAASAPAQELDVPEEVAQRLWQACTDPQKTDIDPGDTEAMVTCMMSLVSTAPVSDAVGFYLDGPSSDL
jgi:xanthine/uracil permease